MVMFINTLTRLNYFKNYDDIISYGYYTEKEEVKSMIELYQDYIFNYSYLDSKWINEEVDNIMYFYIRDDLFKKFIEKNESIFKIIYFRKEIIRLYNKYICDIKVSTSKWIEV